MLFVLGPSKECPCCRQQVTEIETISELCPACANELSIRQLNRLARRQDQSNLYPVFNRFNVTERAIRRLQRKRRQGLELHEGLEYALALDEEISQIVNDPNL